MHHPFRYTTDIPSLQPVSSEQTAVPGAEFTCRALEDAYAAVLDAAIKRLHELRLDIVRRVRMAEVPLHLAADARETLDVSSAVPVRL